MRALLLPQALVGVDEHRPRVCLQACEHRLRACLPLIRWALGALGVGEASPAARAVSRCACDLACTLTDGETAADPFALDAAQLSVEA